MMTKTPDKPQTKSRPDSRFMSMRDGATYLCMSAANLWAIAGRGELPVIRVGRRTLLDRQDLDAFMLARKSKSAA
jgi:hypothetical protein